MKRMLALLAVLIPGSGREAEACGGCFAPPGAFTAVDSHRMVIALGVEETVLWDQFIYSGAPEEFAWVLPVPASGAVVELADDAFVDAIDAGTAPIVQPSSPAPCAAGAGGCGGFGGEGGPIPVEGVDVIQRSTVGPYQTVTLDSADPDALYLWLQVNGYAFPPTAVPILDGYIAAGNAFLVLRLRPGAEVSAMRPVRIRFRGFMGRFPLEMVTLGASGTVELSLWVIAEQRSAAQNYANARIDEADLVWDWATSSSNYDQVFAATIEENGGRAWVTEYAGVLAGSELAAVLKEKAAADYAVVLAGVPVPYLTRLRTRMLVEHIDDDLELGLAEDPGPVPRTLIAGQEINGDCDAPSMSVAGGGGNGGAAIFIAVWLALSRCARRRRR